MKTNQLKPLFAILLLLVILQVQAQDKVIYGLVTTFDSLAIIGADVRVKSTKQVFKTDSLGRFSVQVGTKDKLKITAKGFNSYNVKLEGDTKIVAVNLKLKSGTKAREYAIGYGYVKDGDKLNAMSQLTKNDVNFSNYSSMHELIRGRFAGVQVHSNGDIVIRGVNSINLSSAALIVVDGVPVDQSVLYSMVPSNVSSINVLKDGSAAIYGSRGANGVVIIETRRGGEK